MRAQTRKTEASPKRGKPRQPRGRTPEPAPAEKPRARLKRSPAARTAPIRDATMMFRSAPFSTSAEEREKGNKAPRDADPQAPGGSQGMKGAVEHSVEMAYRVIDELLQRGRRAAGRASHPSTKADPVRNNQNSNLAGMMMQTWMDMGRMWFGMMGPLMLGGFSPWQQQGNGFGGAYPPGREGQSYEGSATNTDGRMKVTLDLRSDRPTEVMIDLNRLTSSKKRLSLQALREKHEAQGKPAITGVDITHHEDGAIRLSVNIPSGQPHGLYTGAISTEDGAPVGAVSVKIHQIHGQPEHARHEPAA